MKILSLINPEQIAYLVRKGHVGKVNGNATIFEVEEDVFLPEIEVVPETFGIPIPEKKEKKVEKKSKIGRPKTKK